MHALNGSAAVQTLIVTPLIVTPHCCSTPMTTFFPHSLVLLLTGTATLAIVAVGTPLTALAYLAELPSGQSFITNIGANTGANTRTVPSVQLQAVQAKSNQSSDASEHVNQGINRLQRGDFQGAIESFNQAIELDPNSALAYGNRGMARVIVGDTPGAIDDFTRVIELDPNDAVAYSSRAITYAESGNHEAALSDFDRAIELEPDFPPNYYNRSLSRAQMDDNQGALEDLDRAIELDASFAPAYGTRALLREELGDKAGAIDDLQKAAELFQAQGDTVNYQRALSELERIQAE